MSSAPHSSSRWSDYRDALQSKWQAVVPGRRAWIGAAVGLGLATILLTAGLAWGAFAGHGWLISGGGFLLFLLAAGGGAVLINSLLNILVRIPFFYRCALVAAILLFAAAITGITPAGNVFLASLFIITTSLLGAVLWIGTHGGPAALTRSHRIIFFSGLAIGLAGIAGILLWVVGDGPLLSPVAGEQEAHGAALNSASAILADLPDPAATGPFTIETWTYGSGADLHRPEYGDQVDVQTEPVNGRAFVSGWSRLRTHFWGFDAGDLPLNGRVWFPEGEGPFPLVLIVHGNHNMADFSDGGYAYLAELFANHGMITVSVDQNFLNSSTFADVADWEGLERENDARAWLLLEHLRQWNEWNQDETSPVAGRVDLERVGLVGHSRGGEAVAIAAAFNRLSRYPDQATITFDYQFGIRAVAAIAPVDGQYNPAGQPTRLKDVSYLAIHGLNDSDVTSFQGSDQYQRVKFSSVDGHLFKAGVYVAGANHGQFNTSWGAFDRSLPQGYALNRATLLDPAEQQQIAQVFLSAFLRTTLLEDVDYRPLFQDARRGADWLPHTPLRTQYADAATRPVALYDEDIEVTTTTIPGGAISTAGLDFWQEYRLRSKTGLHDNSVLYLGWQSASHRDPPAYTVTMPLTGLSPTAKDVLVFSVGDARDPVEAGETGEQLDFTIRLADTAGNQADLPLSHVAPVPFPLTAQLTRLAWMSDLPTAEVILQTMSFPMAAFLATNPEFNPAALATVTFLFDRSPAGRIVLDDIGFRPDN